jgi:hypothetical protein
MIEESFDFWQGQDIFLSSKEFRLVLVATWPPA